MANASWKNSKLWVSWKALSSNALSNILIFQNQYTVHTFLFPGLTEVSIDTAWHFKVNYYLSIQAKNRKQVYLRQQNISLQFFNTPDIFKSDLYNRYKQSNYPRETRKFESSVFLAKLWRYAEFMDTIQIYDMKYNPIFKIREITHNLQESVFQ